MLLAASFVVNLVGGVAFVVVGALLLALRPARPGAIGFAAFALASGGQHIFGNLGAMLADESYGPALAGLRLPFQLVAPAALVWAAARYRGRAVALAFPFLATGAAGALCLLFVPERMLTPAAFNLPLADLLVTAPYFLGIAAAVALLASSLAQKASDALRAEVALLLLATAPPLGYTAAFFLPILLRAPGLFAPSVLYALSATFLACALVVLGACVALARAPERWGRALAVATLAIPLVGGAQGYVAVDSVHFGGVLRIAAALLLGYALLKYRVFDIDVKVRDTLAAGVIMGIAVGGFFVAGEIAESFVANKTGSTAVALAVAAGLLVLETRVTHAGKRLAKRALPNIDDSDAYLTGRRFVVYRTAYETAARDGTLTPGERGLLNALAQELGLTAADVAKVEGGPLTATRSAA